jgi:hypothetical protein
MRLTNKIKPHPCFFIFIYSSFLVTFKAQVDQSMTQEENIFLEKEF